MAVQTNGMTLGDFRNRTAGLDDSMPLVLWNDNDGTSGDAGYVTDTDGQVTISGRLS